MAKHNRQMRLSERHVAYLQPENLSEDMPPPPDVEGELPGTPLVPAEELPPPPPAP